METGKERTARIKSQLAEHGGVDAEDILWLVHKCESQRTMTHQEIMSEAYKLCEVNPTMLYVDFLRELGPRERFAVLIGNLNYQVTNGGWSQWVGNGYARAHREVLWALRKLDTETSHKVARMAETIVRGLAEWHYDFEGEACERASELDGELGLSGLYYEINDQLMTDAEAYLARG